MRRVRALVARALIATSLVAAGLHAAAPSAVAVDELQLTGQATVTLPLADGAEYPAGTTPRTATDYTFNTAEVPSPTKVRVLFPRDYDPSSGKRYPVLYLLHGGAGSYRDWTEVGGTVQFLTDWDAAGDGRFDQLDLIVVMPDAGRAAWYTDWYNNGLTGGPNWETYHIKQLIPWIDANLPTIGRREGRAIAGLSSGGFGAMSYASRNPGLFVAAAAFSGAVDTNTPPVIAGKVIDLLAAQNGGGPGSLFGLRETEEVRWRGHNPWDLAENLRGMHLDLRWGDAWPGGGGPEPPWDFGGRGLERAVYGMNLSFDKRLSDLGIDHTTEAYGPGSHNYYYWNRDLYRTLRGHPDIPDEEETTLMEVFADPPAPPSPFTYRSTEQRYDIYGWNVAVERPVVEFSALEQASPEGFTLSGSGSAVVTTPPVYEAGRRYAVTTTVDGELVDVLGPGSTSTVEREPVDGRLEIPVLLGGPNRTQQYYVPTHDPAPDPHFPDPETTVYSSSPATKVYSTDVTITLIDDIPPEIDVSTPAEGATYVLGQNVLADYSCSDDTSVATCTGSVEDGQPIDTSTAGEHTFTVNATDEAGNTATLTRTYNVTKIATNVAFDDATSAASAQVHDQAHLAAVLTTADGPVSEREVMFSFQGTTYTATTDGSGLAFVDVPVKGPAGSENVSVSYAGDDSYASSLAQSTVEITKDDTAVALTSDTPRKAGESAHFTARLTDTAGPVSGATLSFDFQGATYTDDTDADGIAGVDVPVAGPAGPTPVSVRFGGDGSREPSSAQGTFDVAPSAVPSRIAFSAVQGKKAQVDVSVTLTDPATGTGIGDRNVGVLVDGTLVATVRTGGDGKATRTVTVSAPGGKTFRVQFAGDDAFLPSAAQGVMKKRRASGSSG